MKKLLRHGGRTVCVIALLVALPLGCSATRTARVAQNRQVESASGEAAASPGVTEAGRSDTASTSDDESETSSHVTQVAAAENTPGETTGEPAASSPTSASEANTTTTRTDSYPLDLGGVLGLANGQNPQVILARERINEAYAQVDRADILWLPSLRAGVNYNKHEGTIQDVAGGVFNTSRGMLYGGLGAGAVGAGSPSVPGLVANFHLTDAIFQPKIARFQASSRQFAATSARNDVLCDSAVAYLELLRAERRLTIAREAREKTNRIAELTGTFARVGNPFERCYTAAPCEWRGVVVAQAFPPRITRAPPSPPPPP